MAYSKQINQAKEWHAYIFNMLSYEFLMKGILLRKYYGIRNLYELKVFSCV